MERLFLSYARDPEESFVRAVYEHLMAEGFLVWWDQQSMPSRALTFMNEIRQAIDQAQRLLVILTPKAIASDYVRAEWHHALASDRVVVPVLRQGQYEDLPTELRQLHAVSAVETRPLVDVLAEITRVLRDPVPPLGTVSGSVPALPAHFQPRTREMSALATAIFSGIVDAASIEGPERVLVLHGMGGIGKSVLASAFARAVTTRRVFADGIVWLTATPDMSPLLVASRLSALLSGRPEDYRNADDAQTQMSARLEGKTVLLVLDNIWEIEQLTPILNGLQTDTRVLVTTRQSGLAGAIAARSLNVAQLSERIALQHLADWLNTSPDALPPEAPELAKLCGYLPFAIALNGAMLAQGHTWSNLVAALRDADLQFAEQTFSNYTASPTVSASIQVSVDFLGTKDPAAVSRFLELGAFLWEGPVPAAAIETLWKRSGQLAERQVAKLLLRLHASSLMQFDADAQMVRAHDLIVDYLRQPRRRHELNQLLLDAYWQRCASDWPTGPADGYFHQHLLRHLESADRRSEIHRLMALEHAGSHAWYAANDAIGNVDGFLRDLELASNLARSGASTDGPSAPPRDIAAAARRSSIGQRLRYRLMACSVRTIVSMLPPSLLVRMTSSGLWSATRALAEASQISDPSERINALLALQPFLGEEEKRQALRNAIRAAESVSDPASRAPAFAHLIEHLAGRERETALAEAVQAAMAVTDPFFAPPALAAVFPYLDGTDRQSAVERSLEATRLTGPLLQAAYFPKALPYLEPADRERVLAEALLAAERLGASGRASALSSLIPFLKGPQREKIVEMAIAAANAEPDTRYRVGAIAPLAPYVASEALARARKDAMSIGDAAGRATALIALLPTVGETPERAGMVDAALHAVTQIRRRETRARAMGLLAPHLPAVLLPKAAGTMRAILDQEFRVTAFGALATLIAGDRKRSVVTTAVILARAIDDPRSRADALVALLTELEPPERQALLAEALVTVEAIEDPDWRAAILVAMAPHLQDTSLQSAISLALALPDPGHRRKTLTALGPRMNNVQVQAAADASGGGTDEVRAATLLSLLPWLQGAAQARAIGATLVGARSLGEPAARAETLVALLPYLSDPQERVHASREILRAIQSIEDASRRAKVLAALAPKLDDEQLPDAITIAEGMPEPHSWVNGLAPLLSRLVPEQRASKLVDARRLAATIDSPFTRASVLTTLAKAADGELRQQLLGDALAAARLESSPAWQGGAMAPLAPQLHGELLAEGLDIASAMTDRTTRAHTLVKLSHDLDDNWATQLVRREFESYGDVDADALAALMPLVQRAVLSAPRDAADELWTKALATLRLASRPDCLAIIAPLVAIGAALADEGVVGDCVDAIESIGRWWP